MNSDPEAESLLAALKELLRSRHVGYRKIAEALGVSLPTVKRLLNKPGLPLDRMLAICRVADVQAVEVFNLAEKLRPQHAIFTDEQDDLFHDRPEFLSYFMRLLDGDSPKQIAAECNLKSLSTQRYLSVLEKVGLLEREVGGKIRLLVKPPVGFGPDSKVLKRDHGDFLRAIVDDVLSPDRGDKNVFAILKPLRLERETFREMAGELSAIVDKYAYFSERPSGDGDTWNLAIAAGPGGSPKPAAIVELADQSESSRTTRKPR